MPGAVTTTPFTPPTSASASHIAASENVTADEKAILRAVEQRIGHRDDDQATKTIQSYAQAHFRANRKELPWWNVFGRIRRASQEAKTEQAVLVLRMGQADGSTDGLYVGRRGLLFGSESSNFFQLTDHVPERALKYASGTDQGNNFIQRLDSALDNIADKVTSGKQPPIREASFRPYNP